MFKQFYSVLKQEDLVNQALRDMDIMYQKANNLFDEVIAALAEDREPEFDIYNTDREINLYEKEIRKKIMVNMAINPKQEMVASLILTSIVIDVERIGDYSKNIFELKKLCPESEKTVYANQLMRDAGAVSEIFTELGTILQEHDAELAQILLGKLETLKKASDAYICQTAGSGEATIRDAVTNVLLARYLKRVAAHLGNIASSISNSFDMIGFHQKNE